MRSVWQWLLILLVVVIDLSGGVARASERDPTALESEIAGLDQERARVDGQRAQLEADGAAEVREIDRLKGLPEGVARDYRLGQLLSASQARAKQLDMLSAELRERDGMLVARRRLLVEACGRELGQTGLSETRRVELVQMRVRALGRLAIVADPLEPIGIVKPSDIDPLAGPSELAERADRLQDDQEKLRREQDRLERRIGSLEERKRVRDRAADVEDDLFGETTVGRRAVRAVTTVATGAERTTTTPSAAGVGAADTAPKNANGPSATPGGTTSFDSIEPPPATMLRGLVDPSTLADLRRSERGGDPELELSALKKARGDVARLATELRRRESELRRRATDLKKIK